MSVSLIYMPSKAIQDFTRRHPIEWFDAQKNLVNYKGCLADQAGRTPTPAVEMFLRLYHEKQALFAQREYRDFCLSQWSKDPKWSALPEAQRNAVGIKLQRNFYASMIDSLHVWAMLVETQLFDLCFLDSASDAVGKTDMTVKAGNKTMTIALSAGTKATAATNQIKAYVRGGPPKETFLKSLPMDRFKTPGNKRWYQLSDFEDVIALARAEQVPA